MHQNPPKNFGDGGTGTLSATGKVRGNRGSQVASTHTGPILQHSPFVIGLNTHLHLGVRYVIDGGGGQENEETCMGRPGDVEVPGVEGRNPCDMGQLGALTGGTMASTPPARRAPPLPAGYPRGDGSALWGVNEVYILPVLQSRSPCEWGEIGTLSGATPHTAADTPKSLRSYLCRLGDGDAPCRGHAHLVFHPSPHGGGYTQVPLVVLGPLRG